MTAADNRFEQLRTAIAAALEPFIPAEHLLIPGVKAGLITDVALYTELLLDIMVGDPDAPKPRGIIDGGRRK